MTIADFPRLFLPSFIESGFFWKPQIYFDMDGRIAKSLNTKYTNMHNDII
jgi:hypothetical protein